MRYVAFSLGSGKRRKKTVLMRKRPYDRMRVPPSAHPTILSYGRTHIRSYHHNWSAEFTRGWFWRMMCVFIYVATVECSEKIILKRTFLISSSRKAIHGTISITNNQEHRQPLTLKLRTLLSKLRYINIQFIPFINVQ